MTILRIATRASALALAQSRWVASELERLHPGLRVELVEVRTTGDAKLGESLTAIGGKGAFTKELEDALLDRRCDLAVHSLKDLPTTLPAGLAVVCTPPREDPADVMVLREAMTDPWNQLPKAARIGSSSPRRKALLLARRADFQVIEFRGNVDTRLRKLSENQADAIILARAGLSRLGILGKLPYGLSLLTLEAPQWLPAVSQGCLGIEARADDEKTRQLLTPLHDTKAWTEVSAERAFLRTLGAGCSAPVGALARHRGDQVEMWGAMFNDGHSRRVHASAPVAEAAALGEKLALACFAPAPRPPAPGR